MVSRAAFLLILIGVAVASCGEPPGASNARGREPTGRLTEPAESVSVEGTFAFANEAGTELLALEAIAAPSAIVAAICGGARRIQVRHVRTQSRHPETSHRQVAGNFDNEPGDVFGLEGGAVVPNETCFLPRDTLMFRTATAVTALDRNTCQGTQTADLARIAGRDVVQCWHLGEIPGGAGLVAVQFTHVDSSALAAVALVQDSVLLFHALPGRYDGPGNSIWRVDDGGVFDPQAIRLLFAARLPQGHAAAFLWAGAEGELDQFVVADSSVQARSATTAYRYWAPQ